jgi:peptidoglycan biosynthesis protein MviN/MurJ (putative lipid II flippase)
MRFRRLSTVLTLAVTVLLIAAPVALAHDPGGEGWYGETTDQTVTNTMFIVIIFFPAIIVLFSLIQWRLDKRKHAKMDAAKRRSLNADWRGGW